MGDAEQQPERDTAIDVTADAPDETLVEFPLRAFVDAEDDDGGL